MIKTRSITFLLSLLILASCVQQSGKSTIKVAGAMKNVMWKGELEAIIHLDTITNKTGLYGVGPLEGLRGELLIVNGTTYASHVLNDSMMMVEVDSKAGAPFLVYGNQTQWKELPLDNRVHNLDNLEQFMNEHSKQFTNPFLFRLEGVIQSANIHVQNLPEGSEVHSPKEAHQGQTNFHVNSETVDIIGFYSTKHHGIFTHQNSNMHLHIITKDRSKMGHLDALDLEPNKMVLYVPAN